MTKIIVTWSTAYDNIMKTSTNLKNHLVKKDMDCINMSFIVDDLEKHQWWTWLNIVYNLSLIQEESILLTSIWKDFEFSDFIKENVILDYVHISNNKLTARSYITTDWYNSQLTAFYPWAMDDWCNISYTGSEYVKYAIVSPNHIPVMKRYIEILFEKWIKIFFDPGQQITQMTKEDLEFCFKFTDYLIVNNYEYEILKQQIEYSDEEMISSFSKMIITYWVEGSKIFDKNYNVDEIFWVENPDFVDLTWAGDSYRAWLLKWLNSWYTWEQSAKIWSILASVCTWSIWAQNHFIDFKQLKVLYKETYWDELILKK